MGGALIISVSASIYSFIFSIDKASSASNMSESAFSLFILDSEKFSANVLGLVENFGYHVADVPEVLKLPIKIDISPNINVGKTMNPDISETFAMLAAACVMRMQGDFLVPTEMLEPILTRLKVKSTKIDDTDDDADTADDADPDDDADTDDDVDLFTYLHHVDASLEGLTVDSLEFIEPDDKFTKLFTSDEWKVIFEYLILLYRSPSMCRVHKLMAIIVNFFERKSLKRKSTEPLESERKK